MNNHHRITTTYNYHVAVFAVACLWTVVSYAGEQPTTNKTWTLPELEMHFAPIPAGQFIMGGTTEHPHHHVTLSRSFWLATTEVTNAQYHHFVTAADYDGAVHANSEYLHHWTDGKPADSAGNAPIRYVSWKNARAFCRWLSDGEKRANRLPNGYVYRLPTEAEWEYSCRAGSIERYSYGNDWRQLHRYANYADEAVAAPHIEWRDRFNNDGYGDTAPVASYRPNRWTLYDMHGNVSEWCADWYAPYTANTVVDPAGPRQGSLRVCRGGNWSAWGEACESGVRARFSPGECHDFIGFRVALAPKLPKTPK